MSDATHRIQVVSTPKHTSWLNQIEIWLSLLCGEQLMRARTSDAPVLLLDDILSELDAVRRAHLLQFIDRPDQQTLITAADLADFDPSFLARITRVRVEHGQVLAHG